MKAQHDCGLVARTLIEVLAGSACSRDKS